jgi:hypothetical protein
MLWLMRGKGKRFNAVPQGILRKSAENAEDRKGGLRPEEEAVS